MENSISADRKGAAKAVEQEFQDLNPIITYRHVLSHSLGVRDPLRVIALCDSDAFYAGCEMVRLGVGENVPLVVLQWDLLIAVNYPARKYGISRMNKPNLKELKEKYPDLVIVHVATYKEGEKEPGYWENIDTKTHKVSLDYYRRESAKISAKFRECLPDCEVERASIDEAFFDLTKSVRKVLLERYPYLLQLPPGAPHGVDTPLPPPPSVDWEKLGHVIKMHDAVTQSIDVSQQIVEFPTKEYPGTWHDVALSIGAELMGMARDVVRTQLGYSTSAGIARNKFLAKLTASYKKPNSQSILQNAAIPSYLLPISFQKIRFLGGKFGKALAKEFDAGTVSDLLLVSLEEMQYKFGPEAIWVFEAVRGIDRSEVKEKSAVTKSMQASKSLQKPITDAADGFHWIRVLAAELALRLKEARKNSPSLWPKTIVLWIRTGNESVSKQSPLPFSKEITVDFIAAAGNRLWKELVGLNLVMKVNNISLSFTGIEEGETGQKSIEDFLKRKGDFPFLDLDPDAENAIDQSNSQSLSFMCPRCRKSFQCIIPFMSTVEESDSRLNSLRMEHEDYHYAQDLAQDLDSSELPRRPAKKIRRRTEALGIEKYFKKK